MIVQSEGSRTATAAPLGFIGRHHRLERPLPSGADVGLGSVVPIHGPRRLPLTGELRLGEMIDPGRQIAVTESVSRDSEALAKSSLPLLA
jgi:hypothetical protein